MYKGYFLIEHRPNKWTEGYLSKELEISEDWNEALQFKTEEEAINFKKGIPKANGFQIYNLYIEEHYFAEL